MHKIMYRLKGNWHNDAYKSQTENTHGKHGFTHIFKYWHKQVSHENKHRNMNHQQLKSNPQIFSKLTHEQQESLNYSSSN